MSGQRVGGNPNNRAPNQAHVMLGQELLCSGGQQMNGTTISSATTLSLNGLPKTQVFCGTAVEIPGWYRPEKKWDLLVISDGELIAGIEFKSQVGSFENATTIGPRKPSAAQRIFGPPIAKGRSNRPPATTLAVHDAARRSPRLIDPCQSARTQSFEYFPEFKDASYGKRCEILLTKLVRERLYDSACFLLSDSKKGLRGYYREPVPELCFESFIASLLARAIAVSKTKKPKGPGKYRGRFVSEAFLFTTPLFITHYPSPLFQTFPQP